MADEVRRLEISTTELNEAISKIEQMQAEIAELKERVSDLENT